ncbi:hypothetical protein VTK56DRAFT_5325 [Thermocarpiscus australiensis]
MKKRRAILQLLLSFSGFCCAQKQCYYPSGLEAATDFPCDPNAAVSPCCGGGEGTFCLTNKLCRGPNGNTIRGSCTDQSWSSPECPQFCLGASVGGTDLISCANSTGSDTSYCCDPPRPFCCDEGVARFDVFPSKPEVLARWDAKSSQFIVVQQTSSSTSSSQASTTLTTFTPTTTTSATATALTSTSPPSTPTSSSDASAQSQSQLPSPPPLSVAAQAGIGAGAGVLAIALAAVAFLLFKLRKKKALLAEMEKERQNQQQQQQHNGPGPVYDPRQQDKVDASWYQYQYPAGGMGVGFGVVPRQEMDGQGARFELPSTPGRAY